MTPDRDSQAAHGWFDWVALGIVAFGTGLFIHYSARMVGPTFDEPTYLDCGLKGWREGTHKPLMRLGTMPLPVDLATMPLALMEWAGMRSWNLAVDFGDALAIARATALVFWGLLLFAVFGVSRNLRDRKVAWFAVALVCLEPNLSGHAGLATTDIASLATVLLAWWVHLAGMGRSTFRRLVLPGMAYGLALFTKASALAFVPILVFAGDLSAWMQEGMPIVPGRLRAWARERLAMFGLGLLTVFVLVGSDWGVEPTFVKWAAGLPEGWFSESMGWLAGNLRIFTNAGEGLAQQVKHNMRGHGAYLLGHEAPRAFYWYFPVLLSIKLTTCGLVLLAMASMAARPSGGARVLAVALGLLLLFSFNCRVQIGIRLVFPLLVIAYLVGAETLAKLWDARTPWIRGLGLGFLAGHGFEGLAASPNGLMFSNTPWKLCASPDWMMCDSNFDWGQGLPFAKAHLADQPRPVGLVYFGTDPAANDPAWFQRLTPRHPAWDSPEGIRRQFAGRDLLVGATVARGGPLGREYAHFRKAISDLPWKSVGCMHLISFPPAESGEADLGQK